MKATLCYLLPCYLLMFTSLCFGYTSTATFASCRKSKGVEINCPEGVYVFVVAPEETEHFQNEHIIDSLSRLPKDIDSPSYPKTKKATHTRKE